MKQHRERIKVVKDQFGNIIPVERKVIHGGTVDQPFFYSRNCAKVVVNERSQKRVIADIKHNALRLREVQEYARAKAMERAERVANLFKPLSSVQSC